MASSIKTSHNKFVRQGVVAVSVNLGLENLCDSCEKNFDGSCPLPKEKTPDRPCTGCFPFFSESRCAGCPILTIKTYTALECGEFTPRGKVKPLFEELIEEAVTVGI